MAVEQLKNPLKITTGDGKEWQPLYSNTNNEYSFDYNVSEFEYPEVQGTHVDKWLPKGRRFPMEFVFQGEDHLQVAESFRISSNDRRAWVIMHPAYGRIYGHAISMAVNSTALINTRISIMFVESIEDAGPKTVTDPKTIALEVEKVSAINIESFTESLTLDTTDVTQLKSNTKTMFDISVKSISDNAISAAYKNAFSTATNTLNNALSNAEFSMNAVQNFITYPSEFYLTVKQRLQIFKDQLNSLTNKIEFITSTNEKKIFENNKIGILLGMLKSTSAPIEGDYESGNYVLEVIELIFSSYAQFVDEINDLQSSTSSESNSYIPDNELQSSMNQAVNFTISNLFQVAFSAQQERIIYLENDSNVIDQTHRFYGIGNDNTNLEKFLDTNDIQLDEVIIISKGRKLIYYV
jgi:hypothetical protein